MLMLCRFAACRRVSLGLLSQTHSFEKKLFVERIMGAKAESEEHINEVETKWSCRLG